MKNFTRYNSEGIIRAYIVWCLKYDELCLQYGRTAQTVAKAIEFCLESEEIKELRDYMLEYRTEVEMIMEEYNAQETVINSLVDECRKEGKEEEGRGYFKALRSFSIKQALKITFRQCRMRSL